MRRRQNDTFLAGFLQVR